MLLQANIFAGRGFAAKRPNFLPFYDIAILSKLTGLFDFVGRFQETSEIVRVRWSATVQSEATAFRYHRF